MKHLILLLALATPALAEPRLVEIPEIPDAFHAIPLSKVFWAKSSAEADKAREACGGDFEFVGHRWEGRTLVHLVECAE